MAASITSQMSSEEAASHSWDMEVGLEVQEPWAALIMSGQKNIETRRYALPAALLGRRIYILESISGCPGQTAIPDYVGEGSTSLRILGTVVFSACVDYPDERAFSDDEPRHLVCGSNGYSWQPGICGWLVREVDASSSNRNLPSCLRRYRSLFQINFKPDDALNDEHNFTTRQGKS
uniref:ASCH domain-containing protein n=1 Tax=Octactis speculum TaxID=3111310 RepID=A0A7S2DH91_9STRA|mmetsp:Transcript_49083/g.66889  ORF Transcript_49083/g.66889 Transcript_49083/m.66889 type:complete len:177 (+) Transcript_49083:71-601(+)